MEKANSAERAIEEDGEDAAYTRGPHHLLRLHGNFRNLPPILFPALGEDGNISYSQKYIRGRATNNFYCRIRIISLTRRI